MSEIASLCSVEAQPWLDTDFDLAGGKLPLPAALVDANLEWVNAADVYEGAGELFLHSRTEGQSRHVEIGKYDSSALFSAASLLTYAQLQGLVIAYDT